MSAAVSQPRHTHSCDFHDALSVRPAATVRATVPIASSSSGDTGGLANSDPEANGGAPADYILYGMDVSYFTGKLEAYMQYRELRVDRIEGTLEDLSRNIEVMGTAQVPVVFDRRARRWLHDTTSIIELLETEAEANAETAARQIESASALLDANGMAETASATGCGIAQNIPHAAESSGPPSPSPLSVLPACPLQRFFSFLVEDFADEALWRPAMYYRWAPALDRAALSHRFTFEFARRMPLPQWAAQRVLAFRQWLFSVFGEGIESDAQHAAAQTQYVAALDSMQRILEGGDGGGRQRSRRKFMLGDAPTLADFGMMGSFFRHFSSDPTPRKIMQQRAPAVYRWVARMWDSRRGDLQCAHHHTLAGHTSACHSASSGAGAYALGLDDASLADAATSAGTAADANTATGTSTATSTATCTATKSAHASAESTSGIAGHDQPQCACACVRMCPAGSLPAEWDSLFPQIAQYLRYLHANALAWRARRTSFEFEFHGVTSTVQTVPFRVWCRLRLQQRFQDLLVASPALAAAAESLLRAHACWTPLFADGRVECTPDECGFQPPPVSRGPQTPAARASEAAAVRGDRAPSSIADPTRVEGSPKWPQHALLVRYVRARWLRWLRWLATAAAAVMAWRRWRQWRRGPTSL